MKKISFVFLALFVGLFLGRVSTISYGPGTLYAGQTFLADGTPYEPPEPEIGGPSAGSCRLLSNNPFSRFLGKFHLVCVPSGDTF